MRFGGVILLNLFVKSIDMQEKRKLVIADIHSNNNRGICSGHYYAVAQNYKELFSDVCDVKFASGPIYLKKFREEDMIMLPYDHIAGKSLYKKVIKEIINLRVLLKKVPKDAVIVMQQGAPLSIILGLSLFYRGGRKLYQIQYSNQPMQSRIRRFFYRNFVMKNISGTICPTEELGELYGTSYIVVPDYIYIDSEQKKDEISYSERKYDFCIVGRLNPDKGVIGVIKRLRGTDYKVLIAGRADSEAFKEEIIEHCKGCSNIELRLGYVSDNEYINYIRNSKYCVLNYQAEYARRSSGVIFDILFNGTPVIARRCDALSVIEEFNAGHVVDDISSFNPKDVMSEYVHCDFKKGILEYKKKHREYAELLKSYVLQ